MSGPYDGPSCDWCGDCLDCNPGPKARIIKATSGHWLIAMGYGWVPNLSGNGRWPRSIRTATAPTHEQALAIAHDWIVTSDD